MVTKNKRLVEGVTSLRMNNLQGRMLRVTSKSAKQQEILVIYGRNMSIEAVEQFAFALARYGNVTVPDLPGLGGMTSFYKIKEKPTLDNYAAYLAAFIKLRYKNRRLTIVALDSGLPMAVRMLQRYPLVGTKITQIISLGGFVHRHDMASSLVKRAFNRVRHDVISSKPFAAIAKATQDIKRIVTRDNAPKADTRTSAYIDRWLLSLDVCHGGTLAKLHHVYGIANVKLDEQVLEQHLLVIFKRPVFYRPKQALSLSSALADERLVRQLLPQALRNKLR
jgi:pimeloyl-ACP methyl ester carboxylesterase